MARAQAEALAAAQRAQLERELHEQGRADGLKDCSDGEGVEQRKRPGRAVDSLGDGVAEAPTQAAQCE